MTLDSELLRCYAKTRSEDAFAELVRRHLHCVYSAALRQVNGDSHLAQDVAQMVFADLARKAATLSKRQVLTGWLYTATHYAAAKVVRAERRRHAREQEAHAMHELLRSPAPDFEWEKLRPAIDEVMHQLKESDREAILMRYFENSQLGEIGQKLGLSEEAVRKRVNRALETLRCLLLKRGIATTLALETVLSANAVQPAPAGLAATLTSAALLGGAGGTETAVTLFKLMASAKLKTGLLSAVVAATVLTPLVLQHQAQAKVRENAEDSWQKADQIAELQDQNQRLSNLLAQAQASPELSEDQMHELLRLRGEVGRLRSKAQELAQLKITASASRVNFLSSLEALWSERADHLKHWLEENPSEKIFELGLLTARDWAHAIYPQSLDTSEDYYGAMSKVRARAEGKVLDRLLWAVQRHIRDGNAGPPTNLSQLKPYLDAAIDDAVLQRYVLLPTTNLVPELQLPGDWVLTQSAPVNKELDTRYAMNLTGGRVAGRNITNRWDLTH